ncbi:MAG: hypothetical protein ABSF70_02565 [Terracidiphilus sp.]
MNTILTSAWCFGDTSRSPACWGLGKPISHYTNAQTVEASLEAASVWWSLQKAEL